MIRLPLGGDGREDVGPSSGMRNYDGMLRDGLAQVLRQSESGHPTAAGETEPDAPNCHRLRDELRERKRSESLPTARLANALAGEIGGGARAGLAPIGGSLRAILSRGIALPWVNSTSDCGITTGGTHRATASRRASSGRGAWWVAAPPSASTCPCLGCRRRSGRDRRHPSTPGGRSPTTRPSPHLSSPKRRTRGRASVLPVSLSRRGARAGLRCRVVASYCRTGRPRHRPRPRPLSLSRRLPVGAPQEDEAVTCLHKAGDAARCGVVS